MWPPFWFLAPPSGYWPPLLRNPGDGPKYNQTICAVNSHSRELATFQLPIKIQQ